MLLLFGGACTDSRLAILLYIPTRSPAEVMRKSELEKALKLIQKGESVEKVLEALSNALTNKFLHAPSHALNLAHGDEHTRLENTLKQLYQIKDLND